MKKRLLSILLVIVLAFSLCGTALASPATAPPRLGLKIIHTNDVHGAIDAYAKIAALRDSYVDANWDVLLVDAGDFSQGTVYVSLSKGANAWNLMDTVGYDCVTLGNHEFDYGFAQLQENIGDAWVSVVSNVKYNGADVEGVEDYTTYYGKYSVAVFGLSTPETQTKANPALIQGVSFGDPSADAKAVIAELNALESPPDYVVCLGHLGVDPESVPYRSIDLLDTTSEDYVEGIDIFIDGHSHSVILDGGLKTPIKDAEGTITGYDYPALPTGDTVLASTGSSGENVGVITITDEGITSEIIALSDLTDEDENVKALADGIKADIDAEYGVTFATSEVLLNGAKAPGNRTMETNLGDLVTDAMMWKCAEQKIEVDCAVTNGGGIRAPIKAGDITKKDVNTVLPFGNTMSIITVTGAELLEALEASTFCTPTANGGFPQVSGIEFTVDAFMPYKANNDPYPGSTYFGPALINRVTIDTVGGEPFDPSATYKVCSNNFTAAGGDTYYVFSAATGNIDTGLVLDEVVMEYIDTALEGVVTEEDYGESDGEITIKFPTDVDPNAWYYTSLQRMYAQHVIKGVSPTEMAPNAELTRATFITLMYRFVNAQLTDDTKVSSLYSDCADDAWYADAVVWATKWYIASGFEDGTFRPDDPVTREQMAMFIYRFRNPIYVEVPTQVVEPYQLPFTDVDQISGWAVHAVAYCCANNLMYGIGDNLFAPQGTGTRAQGAATLARLPVLW